MQDNGAMKLLSYLFEQLDALAAIDLNDQDKVDAACRVNKAVNDTSRSIIGVADLSLKAMADRPTMGSRSLLEGFFSEGGDTYGR